MASAHFLPCDEQFLCSICLEVFTEPVSTPCGHNYCKSCITGYWDSCHLTQCPLCKKRFRRRPHLQVNTGFRDMVEHFKNMRVRGGDEVPAKPGEVPCDICLGPKLKAQKTCLVCLASYCQTHLEPHQRVASLKKHKLIHPVSNLEDRVCKKHDKMLEFFCRTDRVCVCFMCLKDDHVLHEAVPLERVSRERKAWLERVTTDIKMMENSKSESAKEVKQSVQQSKTESEREIADIVEVFAALVTSLRRRQVELIELIQEKQKAAETQAEDHIRQLEQEAAELRKRRSEMEQLLETEDHLHLLQSCPSLHSPADNEDLFNPLSHSAPPFTQDLSDISQHMYVGMVKKSVAQMEKTLCNEMEMLIHEVRLSDGCEAAKRADAAEKLVTDDFIKEVWNPPQDSLMMIQQCHAINVTMDPNTINCRLRVSEDGKQLRVRERLLVQSPSLWRNLDTRPYVLAADGFCSGRFYYEVRVTGCESWYLGVVKEHFDRGIFFPPTEKDYWILGASFNELQDKYFVNTVNVPSLCPRQRPQTVGVFIDYERGEVSFYDVEARSLIYSFTGCTFIETTPALKAFLFSMAGIPFRVHSKPKLYPFFGTDDSGSNNVLEITPVGRAI